MGAVESFRVTAHGNTIAFGKMAGVTSKGDRIIVTPFDSANVQAVVRALTEARLNAYALNPRTVAVSVPPISGEQRDTDGHRRSWGRRRRSPSGRSAWTPAS